MKTVYEYPSRSEPGVVHKVTVTSREGSKQVAVRCTCPPAKYTRWQECWHMLDVVKKHKLMAVVGGVLYNYPAPDEQEHIEDLDPNEFCTRHGKPLLDGMYGFKASNCEDCDPEPPTFDEALGAVCDANMRLEEARRLKR